MIDERKNAEGYNDFTAYNAIKKVQLSRDIQKGDVFWKEKSGGGRIMLLVVSGNEANAEFEYVQAVLLLSVVADKMSKYNVIVELDNLRESTAACNTLQKVYKDTLTDRVTTIAEEEQKKVDKALEAYLGINVNSPKTVEKTPTEEPTEKFKMYLERVKLTTERDMYKQLYEQTLQKLLES